MIVLEDVGLPISGRTRSRMSSLTNGTSSLVMAQSSAAASCASGSTVVDDVDGDEVDAETVSTIWLAWVAMARSAMPSAFLTCAAVGTSALNAVFWSAGNAAASLVRSFRTDVALPASTVDETGVGVPFMARAS